MHSPGIALCENNRIETATVERHVGGTINTRFKINRYCLSSEKHCNKYTTLIFVMVNLRAKEIKYDTSLISYKLWKTTGSYNLR